MQNFNYHTHTYRCGHTQKDMTDEDFVKEFIKKGFKKIAFTDHCPEKQVIDKRNNMRMEYSQINEYLDSINSLKAKYKDKIKIETGFEIEYLPGQEDNLFELKKMTDKIVHPDLYMLNRNEFGKIERKVAEIICKVAEEYDIPLEINLTEAAMFLSKLKDKIKYPCREFWEVASNYNIKVIYGIDAHYKDQIRQYEESIELVNKIIGESIIKKLNFCNDKLEIKKY